MNMLPINIAIAVVLLFMDACRARCVFSSTTDSILYQRNVKLKNDPDQKNIPKLDCSYQDIYNPLHRDSYAVPQVMDLTRKLVSKSHSSNNMSKSLVLRILKVSHWSIPDGHELRYCVMQWHLWLRQHCTVDVFISFNIQLLFHFIEDFPLHSHLISSCICNT